MIFASSMHSSSSFHVCESDDDEKNASDDDARDIEKKTRTARFGRVGKGGGGGGGGNHRRRHHG